MARLADKTITRQRPLCKRPVTGHSQNTDALLLPGGTWTPHNLRRTGTTLMVAAGSLPDVAERCLNHTENNKVKRTCQRYSHAKEMNQAWQAPLALLTSTDTDNVIPVNFSRGQ